MGCGQSGGQATADRDSKGVKAHDKQQAKEENKQYQARAATDQELIKILCVFPTYRTPRAHFLACCPKATMSFLSQVPLFMRLPKDQHPILAAACVNQGFKAGETIITQGDVGREFFIIQSGEAEVLVGEGGSQKSPVMEFQIISGVGLRA